MSEPHDDELRRLVDAMRDEYERSAAPEPAPVATDEATERSVAWLRDAWNADSERDGVPAIPMALVRSNRRRSRRANGAPRWRAAAALTALAASVAAAIVLTIVLDGTTERPDTGATTAVAEPVEPTTNGASEEVAAAASTDAEPFTGDSFQSRDDGVELVHGSVRIVLLTSAAVTSSSTETP